MVEALSPAERETLLGFLGYGNPRAPVVFVGMEEGLTETPDYPLLAQLKDRAKLEPLVDLRDSRVHPDKYLRGSRPPIQRTWGVLIRVMLALEKNLAPSNDQIRFYQRDKLGDVRGDSALLELLPLPSRSMLNWAPYDEYFPEFRTRDAYRAIMTKRRISALEAHLVYGPKLVVAYGSGYWPEYRAIFPSIKTWTTSGAFKHGRSGKNTVILMPHPVARTMNGQLTVLSTLIAQVSE